MEDLENRAQTAAEIRLRAKELVNDPAFSTSQLEQLLQKLQRLLQQPAIEPVSDYAAFLQLNLDWLQTLMAQLTEQKEALAVSMLELRQGRKATRSYGQHN